MAWEDVVYSAEALDNPHITELLKVLADAHVNGGVIFRSFRATDEATFDHALKNYHRPFEKIFEAFLTRPSVVASLPELEIQLPLERLPTFNLMPAFGVEGALTHILLVGGAYKRFQGTVDDARTLTRRFMEALFGEELQWVGWSGCRIHPGRRGSATSRGTLPSSSQTMKRSGSSCSARPIPTSSRPSRLVRQQVQQHVGVTRFTEMCLETHFRRTTHVSLRIVAGDSNQAGVCRFGMIP